MDPIPLLKEAGVIVGRTVSTPPAITAARLEDIGQEFQLVEIPAVMQHSMSAPQGAELIRQWFSSPAFVMAESWRLGNVSLLGVPSQNLNTTTIKMKWVLGNSAVASGKLSHLENNLVTTPAAAAELRRVLQRQQFLTGQRQAIGTSRDVVVLHETAHLNAQGVKWGMSVSPIDCALGSFTLHMAVSGFVQPITPQGTSKTHEVQINELHFYLRDSYDFTTDREPLGSWNRTGASVSPYGFGMYFAENKVFRQWRAKHGKGGDFLVFSDLLSKKLPRSITAQI